ncbi:hypothetical protein FHW67_002706 [Herbaspirillum sp. Sphag1AN]|uniref:glycine-rich domain-containing protein n=1 Tax=unclassified Herbaspirillum TaxID=2624150 RepID=UPI001622E59D|nr:MULTISPECIES: hypothetical protein [unclassified Herbaspirillum]MBB3213414.1 hypothetical protein [Herbaspirillum sp. Sphag1AN]MBB3246542.1 hypothetical protein [Herbaspirillum sp. Sphag64]
MDRIETYVGQSILEWNFSKPDQNKMVALAKMISLMFGSTTMANGLACTQQTVATMFVNIGAGEIYQAAQLEATACGTLPADTAHTIMKQGIALDTVVVPNSATGVTAFTAPATSGQSINYLIEAAYADSDVSIDPTTGTSPVVLPFYNSSNPQSPLQGPGGTSATSNTFRKGIVSLQVKAGAAATTGSQTTPAPDSGYVGLWVVTVAYGQTSITSANIAAYPGAPILPSSILASLQSGNLQYGQDVGTTANVVQGSFPLPPAALGDTQPFWVKIKNTNTGATTFTPNAGVIAASPLVGAAHAALQGGELIANGRALIVWRPDITSYVLIVCTGGAVQVANATASQHAVTLSQLSAATAGRLLNIIYYSVVTQTVTATIASPGVFTPSLGASNMPRNGSPIVFTTTGALPTGITAGTTYYVVNAGASTFQVAATVGGTPIVTTGSQSGTHTMSNPVYTKATNNPSFVITEVWGGGGGSGGIVGSAWSSGGGGSAGYARQKILSANLLATETVTVGAGGTAGTTSGTNGGTGGTSSFGSHSSATGGGGSSGGSAAISGNGAGGTPGSGVGGDLNLTGNYGQNGVGANGTYGSAGNGGASSLGGAGLGYGASTTGGVAQLQGAGSSAAPGSGSGAGGSCSLGTAETGATGGSGLAIVYEYA